MIQAGGWMMAPIILCSVISMAIILERFWSLQEKKILPPNLVAQVWQWSKAGHLDAKRIQSLRNSSPLGRILAVGLVNVNRDRAIMKESIQEVGSHVAHELDKYLTALGTIASISPLLGLLGTVTGMIKSFAAISKEGVANPITVSGGISEALITTAAGLVVAIPALMFYRYFRSRVESLVVQMEQESLKLVEVIHGDREKDEDIWP